MRTDPHNVAAHAGGERGTLVVAHHAEMLEERREGEQQPSARGQNEDQEDGRKDGVAETPRYHPVRRYAARSRQDHAIDPRKRKETREGHDDRLHTHDDDHQSEQDLVDHADTNRYDKHAER